MDWNEEKIERILPKLKWVRFTVAAGTASICRNNVQRAWTYGSIWQCDEEHKICNWFKEKKESRCYFGIQMVLMPEFKDEIIPFAKLGVDLVKIMRGHKTLFIRHWRYIRCWLFRVQKFNGSTHWGRKSEQWETKVIVKWSKVEENNCTYESMYGPQFLLQISGSGLVAPSGMFFNVKHSCIWNFTDERFIDMQLDGYMRVMNYLLLKDLMRRQWWKPTYPTLSQ